MDGDDDFFSFKGLPKELVTINRPLRLRLDLPGGVNDDMLLPQRVSGSETLCGGVEYRILCVSARVNLQLKHFIAVPVALDFVTDSGGLRSVCGIVTEAASGDSDGGLATYQLVLRDALAILEKRVNTRVFRVMNEVEIVRQILNEWRHKNPTLGVCFKHEVDETFGLRVYPRREFTMQHNESDAAFIRRLLARRGIGWYVRPEADSKWPVHSLVLFNYTDSLRRNAAGTVRYHRDNATEERDTITSWSAVRSLRPGKVTLHSWDYRNPLGRDFMMGSATSAVKQGGHGDTMAASLDDYRVLMPHAGDNNDDLCRLGKLRMTRHDYESKCFHGVGSVRDLCAGEYFTLEGHPEIDGHPRQERDFIVTALQVTAQNNLPKALAARVERLFARSRWMRDAQDWRTHREVAEQVASGPLRMHIEFTAVRRGVTIVPAYDELADVPHALPQSAVVVGPPGEEVYCDRVGRVKIRFPATRAADHEGRAGASESDADSAWVRVASNWAGDGPGGARQCGTVGLPRVGTEVLVNFLGGDPDKPVIVGQLYNDVAPPPGLSGTGGLPGNRYLSGIKSREIKGGRANQLRLDDTHGQISAQLASDHGKSQLNLGFLTEPKVDGHGAPRGEGAELSSDEQLALRAAKGMLLSAWAQAGGTSRQMERERFLALMKECTELAQSLGDFAAGHQGKKCDSEEPRRMNDAFASWESGSNTEPRGTGGGEPMIAVTAPAGISFAAQKTLVSYAGAGQHLVAQQNLQLASGQRTIVNAGQGLSLFSHGDGINLIAHKGKLLLQSQHDETELNAAKDIKFTATEGKLLAMAKEIVLIAEDGSFIKIGGGITIGTKGAITHHGASFPFKNASSMTAALPAFDSGNAELKFQARYYAHMDGGIPAPELDIVTDVSDGSKQEECNDADGKTRLIEREAMHFAAAQAIRNKQKG